MMSQEEWSIRSKWLSEDNAYQDELYLRSLMEQELLTILNEQTCNENKGGQTDDIPF
jgi:hypothetical protein